MHDLTANLPPPHDDEPASLRQDIIDELTDHLECATRRELLTGPSSGPCETASDSSDSSFRTAQHRALTRFGNPATIARKLWLDAMQEKLMAQKITLTLAAVATATCVVMCLLMWQALERGQQAQAALLQQNQEFTQTLLQEFRSSQATPTASLIADGWSPLTIKLVSDAGEPVEGKVNVYGTRIGGEGRDMEIVRDVGAEGVVELGMVPYGNYRVAVLATAANETHTEHFMVTPGEPSDRTIVCPTTSPPEVDLKFAFNPPELLESAELHYMVTLNPRARLIGTESWETSEGGFLDLWVDASGQILKQFERSDRIAGVPPGIMGLVFKPAPRLKEYVYDVVVVGVALPIQMDELSSTYRWIDKWAIVPNDRFHPHTVEQPFEPRAGAENLCEQDIPDDVWTEVINDFRMAPQSRQVTIPDGWETVTLTPSGTSGPIELNSRADVLVYFPEDEEDTWKTLLSSAQIIAIESPPAQGFGGEFRYVLLVRPEQKAAIELATHKTIIRLHNSESETDTPVLDESVLEEIKALPDRDEDSKPGF